MTEGVVIVSPRRRRDAVFALGLAIGAIATFGGYAAPLFPRADMLNHIRPATLLGCLAFCCLAYVFASARHVLRAAAVGATINLALTVLPWFVMASTAPTNADPALRIVTWNVNWGNRDLTAGAGELRRIAADVVVLQEITLTQLPQLLGIVGDLYPHRVLCETPRCTGALLSRHPLSDTQHTTLPGRTHGRLAATVARTLGFPQAIRVAGLHLQYPLLPTEQAAHLEQVIAEVRSDLARGLPYIIAGDFNLTPWSYQLGRFAAQTGLVRHTSHRTWPDVPIYGLPVALFSIDHVFSSGLKTVAVVVHGGHGSDHRMVEVTLAR